MTLGKLHIWILSKDIEVGQLELLSCGWEVGCRGVLNMDCWVISAKVGADSSAGGGGGRMTRLKAVAWRN